MEGWDKKWGEAPVSVSAFCVKELVAQGVGGDGLERGQGLGQPERWGMGKAGSREGLLRSLGTQRMCSLESVAVPVGTAVDFFSSLGVGVEKAACHKALGWGTDWLSGYGGRAG